MFLCSLAMQVSSAKIHLFCDTAKLFRKKFDFLRLCILYFKKICNYILNERIITFSVYYPYLRKSYMLQHP